MNLYELARIILLLNHHPISKVRFARTIYFTHKELVRKKFMKINDIAYIRSPLGPIPDGFLSLARDYTEIIVKHNPTTNLSYATEEYTINPDIETDSEISMLEQYREILSAVEHTLGALQGFTTPQLVHVSHTDPSWLDHSNGELYYLTPADLKNTFPFTSFSPIQLKIRLQRPKNNRSGALQATLLKGMIADIVKESTDLEYPDDKNTAKPPQKPSKIPFLRFKFNILKKPPSVPSASPTTSEAPLTPNSSEKYPNMPPSQPSPNTPPTEQKTTSNFPADPSESPQERFLGHSGLTPHSDQNTPSERLSAPNSPSTPDNQVSTLKTPPASEAASDSRDKKQGTTPKITPDQPQNHEREL